MSSLVQIMACRLFSAKPLSEPMMSYISIELLAINIKEIWIDRQWFSFREICLSVTWNIVLIPWTHPLIMKPLSTWRQSLSVDQCWLMFVSANSLCIVTEMVEVSYHHLTLSRWVTSETDLHFGWYRAENYSKTDLWQWVSYLRIISS